MIDDQLAAFLQQGLGIHLGTRNARLEPNATHVSAAVVDADGTHVTVFVPSVAAGAVLPDLQSNGQAAVVFARPADDRSCQVKGTFVSARPATDAERALVEAQWRGFMAQLELIGLPGEANRQWPIWPAVAMRIRVRGLFSQTPGPNAGAPL